jgi:hypothetical protein
MLDMPINNPDDRKERFPKDISRRLFPKFADLDIRERLERAIMTHCHVELPITGSPDPLKPPSHRTDPSPVSPMFDPPRRRHSNAIFSGLDTEESAPIRPIERERKPYIAQPGGGKIYDGPVTKASGTSPIGIPSSQYLFDSRSGHARSPSTGGRGYGYSEGDLIGHEGIGGGEYTPSASFVVDGGDRRYRDIERERDRDRDRDRERERDREWDRDDGKGYESRDRGRDRDKGRWHDDPSRDSWDSDEEYYRSTLAGKGGRNARVIRS